MSYANLIDRNLVRAFNMVKDLAVDITLNRATSAGFNFATGEVSKTEVQVITKAIFVDSTKKSKEHTGGNSMIMFKQKDLGSLEAYDSFTLNGIVWKLGKVVSNDGYIALVEVSKDG